MATLRDALRIAQQEPTSERSQKLKQAILSGKMDAVAQREGLMDVLEVLKSRGGKKTVEAPSALQKTAEIASEKGSDLSKAAQIKADIIGEAGTLTTDIEPSASSMKDGEAKTVEELKQIPKAELTEEEIKKLAFSKLSSVEEFTTGIGKSFLNSLVGAGKLMAPGFQQAVDASEDLGKENIATKADQFLDKATTPTNSYESAGKTFADIGQFFIPGAAAGKAGVAAKAESGLAKLAKEMAQEGIEFGTISALQEGEVNKDTLIAAGIASAFPAAGKTLEPVAKLLREKVAPRLINSLIKPSLKEFNYGSNPGKIIAEKQISANTLDDLFKKLRAEKKLVGQKIGESARSATERVDAEKIIKDFLSENGKRINLRLIDEGGEARFNRIIDRLYDRDIKNLDGAGLHELQKDIGNMTIWSGQAYEKEVNQLLHDLYMRVGKRLDEIAPGTKALQREYAGLLGAEKSAERRAAQAARANAVMNFSPALIGSASGTVAALNGDSLFDSATIGLLSTAGVKAAGSTFVKSRLASFLAGLGKKPSEIEKILTTLTEVGAIEGAQSLNEEEENKNQNNDK